MGEQISVRTRFERFPATVKGAFILRGEDRDPHQIIFQKAQVVRIGDTSGQPVPMKVDLLNVAPKQDMFLPFEYSTTELPSGWYTLRLDLDIDGIPKTFDDGRRFSAPWPRGAIRRGAIAAGDVLHAGETAVAIDAIECNADTAVVRASVRPAEHVADLTLTLHTDTEALPVIEATPDADGTLTALVFPILRSHRELVITAVVRNASSAPATVKLPG